MERRNRLSLSRSTPFFSSSFSDPVALELRLGELVGLSSDLAHGKVEQDLLRTAGNSRKAHLGKGMRRDGIEGGGRVKGRKEGPVPGAVLLLGKGGKGRKRGREEGREEGGGRGEEREERRGEEEGWKRDGGR